MPSVPACTQQFRPAAKDGSGLRYIHHGNGTSDPHLYGSYFPGQGLESELIGFSGASIRIEGFAGSPVCVSLAVDGELPDPRGPAEHSIVLPRDVTVTDGYRWRDPDYGDGTYAARLETLPINVGGLVTHEHYLKLAITIACRMPGRTAFDTPILYFLGNTNKLAAFLSGEEIEIPNRLNCESAITSLFQTTAGRAIIRGVNVTE